MSEASSPSASGGRLEGKRALVTGAASGIGRATALRFAVEGARVALIDTNAEGLAEVAAEIGSAERDRVAALVADVTDAAAVEHAIGAAVDAFGGLDVIVANAAINFPDQAARVHELELEVWRRTIEVNLTGVFLTCKYALRALLRSGGGSVVCTGSPTGLRGSSPQHGAYSASKAGVMALTRVMAAEYADDGIRVNSIVPGFTETPFVKRALANPEVREAIVGQIPLRRPAAPDEIASMIVFLASDESSYATGSLFIVDGGATAV